MTGAAITVHGCLSQPKNSAPLRTLKLGTSARYLEVPGRNTRNFSGKPDLVWGKSEGGGVTDLLCCVLFLWNLNHPDLEEGRLREEPRELQKREMGTFHNNTAFV